MHRCLSITEILLKIFGEFCPQPDFDHEAQVARHTLLMLAGTCQAFKDPALDILWETLFSLDRLIWCLPSDAWTTLPCPPWWNVDDKGSRRTYMKYLSGSFSLARPLTNQDWSIIMSYAQRVRTLCVCTHTYEKIVHIFNCPTTPSLVFPNLHTLHWSGSSESALPCLEQCLSPTLSRLSIAGSCSWTLDSVKKRILDTLEKRRPQLLEFKCPRLQVEVVDPLSDLICSWTQLVVVETIVPNARASAHLASLSSLRKLDISIPPGWGSVVPHLALPSGGARCAQFPETLEELRLSGQTFSSCAQYLAMIRAAPLSLRIESSTTTTAVEIQELSKVLAGHISLHRLRLLYIETMVEPEPEDMSHVLSVTHVKPLMKFTQLEELDLGTLCPGDIQDSGINNLVSAWPNLKRFFFGTTWQYTVVPSITLRGLQAVLEQCGKLENIGLFMDFTVPPEMVVSESQPYMGVVHPNVRHLNVGGADCVDTTAIGEVVSAMLPYLEDASFSLPKWDLENDPGPEAEEERDRIERWDWVIPCTFYRRWWTY